jgi:hypothetical protein
VSRRIPSVAPQTLLGITIRRALVLGRLYLVLGIGYLTVLTIVISTDTGTAYASGIALFLPIFAVLGSMGGVTLFSGDRSKGVYEYLMGYGVSPRRLFVDVLITSFLLTTVVLGISLGIGLGVYLARGGAITSVLVLYLGLYALPMSYASAGFTAMVGMYWTSLSSPRQGMNSAIGIMPLVGIAPSIITLVAAGTVAALDGTSYTLVVTSIAVILIVAAVLLLLGLVGRLLTRERLLSNQ